MSADSLPPPGHCLADAFAAQAGRWARALAAPAASVRWVERAAWRLSQALADGDTCLSLDDLVDDDGAFGALDTARQALLQSGIVGSPEAPGARPLILDGDGRLYLHRSFDYECRLARALAERARPEGPVDVAPEVRALLARLFPATPSRTAPDWQQVGAALALLGRLTILSGGPGTGKTTTLVNLLACLLTQAPDSRIALAAPTGKAAARMIEALRPRAAQLPADIQAGLPSEAFTVHRLLGMNPATGQCRFHRDHPLAVDVLVVDEASMLDLALAVRLLEAVPGPARVILLGDKDQLAAVESGAVFAEISADPQLGPARSQALAELCGLAPEQLVPPAAVADTPALSGSVVWLTRNFRFAEDSGIGRLARAINAGAVPAALELLARGGGDVAWYRDEHPERSPAETGMAQFETALLAGYEAYLTALAQARPDPAEAFRAFDRFRCLCAVREGSRGVAALNRLLGAHVRRRLGLDPDPAERTPWYPGRPVLVTRNDPVLRLFNGDIGLTLADDSGELRVFFPDDDGGYRALPPLRLPPHETAFAMSIHKSQGSEFDRVMVVLPTEPSRVLTRELLYTGLTRARQAVDLVAREALLAQAIGTPTRRRSGLMARIREWGAQAAHPSSSEGTSPPPLIT